MRDEEYGKRDDRSGLVDGDDDGGGRRREKKAELQEKWFTFRGCRTRLAVSALSLTSLWRLEQNVMCLGCPPRGEGMIKRQKRG